MSTKDYPDAIRNDVNFKWFNRKGRANFERFAPPTVDRYLKIGSWEGASFFWICQHRHPRRAISIDPYSADRLRTQEENRQRGERFEQLWRTFYPEVKGLRFQETSRDVFPALLARGEPSFDMIYIDGSHEGPTSCLTARPQSKS